MAAQLTANIDLNIASFLSGIQRALNEARGFSANVGKSLQGIDVTVDTAQAKREFKSLESEAGKTGSSIASKLQGALSGSGGGILSALGGGAAIGLATGGLAALAAGVFSVGKQMIEGNQEMETYRTQLTSLMGNSDAAKERLAELAKFGAETPFELPELVEAEKVLLGFGLSGEAALKKTGKNATELRSVLGDVAAGTGQKFGDIANLIGKFSSGATGESISRLQELGVVTREELKEVGIQFSKSGELVSPVADALTATTKIMEQKFGGGMKALSETAGGQLSTLSDNVQQTLIKIGEPIFDVFKKLVSGINEFLGSAFFAGLMDGIKIFFEATFTLLKNIFVSVGEAFAPLIDLVKSFFASAGDGESTIKSLVEVFGLWIDVLVTVQSFLIDVLVTGVQMAFEALRALFGIGKSVLGFFIDFKDEAKDTGEATQKSAGAMESFKNALTTVKSVIAGVSAAFKEIKNVIGDVVDALQNIDLSTFDKIYKIFAKSGERVGGAFTAGVKTKVEEIASNGAFQAIEKQIVDLGAMEKDMTAQQLAVAKAAIQEEIKAKVAAGEITTKNETAFIQRLARIKKAGATVDEDANKKAEQAREKQRKALEDFNKLKTDSTTRAIESELEQQLSALKNKEDAEKEHARELAKIAKVSQEELNSVLANIGTDYDQQRLKLNEAAAKKAEDEKKKIADAALKAQQDIFKNEIDLLKTQEEALAESDLKRFDFKAQILQKQMDLELLNTELTEAGKQAIRDKYANIDAKNAEDKKKLEEKKKRDSDLIYDAQETLREKNEKGELRSFSQLQETIVNLSKKAADKQIENAKNVTAIGEIAFAELGLAAAASFVGMYTAGQSAMKSILGSIADTVTAAIGLYTPQILALFSSFIPPPFGQIAGFSAIAAVQSLLAIGRSAAGFREGGWTGEGGTYQPAGIVHAREFVVKSEFAAGFRPYLEMMNKGIDPFKIAPVFNPNIHISNENAAYRGELRAVTKDLAVLQRTTNAIMENMGVRNIIQTHVDPHRITKVQVSQQKKSIQSKR